MIPRPWYRETQAQSFSTRLLLKLLWLVPFLQGLQIVREYLDLPQSLLHFPSARPFPPSLAPPRLSIAVIFVINLSRCKNVLLRNPADLVAAPISG